MAPFVSKLFELNIDQLRISHKILNDVYKKNKTKSMVLFVSGAGGTGKTVLIHHLVDEIGIAHVIVCGSTAMAGKNINGKTIHSVFNLNPFSEAQDDVPLPPHPHLLLLIIDEVSMCDSKLLRRIEKRMRQIMQNDHPFGGCTVALFGDLLQIPPVSTKKDRNGKSLPPDWIFKSPLWKHLVEYEELEIAMRQEHDIEFAEMLKRWRIGIQYPEDRIFLDEKAKLCSRDCVVGAVSEFQKCLDEEKTMMILAHTNEMIGKLNRTITLNLFDRKELFTIAQSTYSRKEEDVMSKVDHIPMFLVADGSRVLINKNVDTRFVNGELCIVRNIQSIDNRVVSLDLTLTSTNETVHFQPTRTCVINNSDCESWSEAYNIQPAYAVTYHKAQGQTLDEVFLAATKQLPPALFYVGASRVRTREGLHILNIDTADSICADPEALEEYKRLRVSIGKSPLPL